LKTFEWFVEYAYRRLKIDEWYARAKIERFLQQHKLNHKIIECYLNWDNGERSQKEIGNLLDLPQQTVSFYLLQLCKVCPQLFIRRKRTPDLIWMFHPSSRQWWGFDEYSRIKRKF